MKLVCPKCDNQWFEVAAVALCRVRVDEEGEYVDTVSEYATEYDLYKDEVHCSICDAVADIEED